jgi:Tfp pilus assembly protein PilO
MKLQFNKVKTNEKYSKYLELIPDFKKEKTQKFTTVVLTIIAIIFLAIFAINPTLSTIAKLQKQLDDAKFVTGKLQEKINDLSVLQAKYNSLQSDLLTIYESVPQDAQVPKITGQIQSLAQDSNINLLSVQVNQITKSPQRFSYYVFNLNATGSYDDINSFLNNLVSMQRITDINSVNVTSGIEKDGSLQLSVRGEAFFKE